MRSAMRVSALSKFQSLVGFKINWNKSIFKNLNATTRFQSLVGFKINWNTGIHCQDQIDSRFNP